ncbi:MAG TPA: hypothetical protein VN812_23560 [Candidatus Acidoferrales bacterium]|nr:hypothetical protein [Candidatus Acidoferrales bacterium]
MHAISILIGLAVLLYGRQLFWLFVAGVGFALGMMLAGQFLTGAPHWQVLLVALAIGLVGAWCAVVFERLAVAVAGFLVGAAIAVGVMQLTGAGSGALMWMVAVAGGIFGALVVAALFDWALIVLSSAVGAALVTDAIGANPSSAAVLFTLLLLFGLIAQARRFKGNPRAVTRL